MALIKKFKVNNYKNSETIVELKNVSVFYNKRQIIENLNLKINKQEILGILGFGQNLENQMERMKRLELSTPTMARWCSTN